MRCSNCGAELREGATFCQECGTPVTKEKKYSSSGDYVLVSGTEIDLEEKTDLYKMARDSLIKAIIVAIFGWVPLLPFFIGIPVISKHSEIKQLLSKYDNETNIVNVMLTDRIRWADFAAFLICLLAVILLALLLLLWLTVGSLVSSFSRNFGYFF